MKKEIDNIENMLVMFGVSAFLAAVALFGTYGLFHSSGISIITAIVVFIAMLRVMDLIITHQL